MPNLPSRIKNVAEEVTQYLEHHPEYRQGARIIGNMKRAGYIEVLLVSPSNPTKSIHDLRLDADDQRHLNNGGRIVYVYLCGHRLTVEL